MFEFLKKRNIFKQGDSLKDKFSSIYHNNTFGGRKSRSGEGSDLDQTAEIRRELPKLLLDLGVKTFLDAPCGDRYWMKEASLGVDKYFGVDIVDALIEKHTQQFGDTTHGFLCLNLTEDKLPQADIIFCRDCLVHLSFDDAYKVLINFKRSNAKYLLTTTFANLNKNYELEGKNSFWRALNLELPPFNFPKPLKLINENCTEENNQYTDKCLALWRLEDIRL